jgi:thiol-disulfide isomerase/thioredoxin
MKRPYYLFSSGRLCRRQNTLCLERASSEERTPGADLNDDGTPSGEPTGEKTPFPVESASELYLFGEIDVNAKLIAFLAQHHVPAHFFDYYGNYTATIYPREHLLSGQTKVRQVTCHNDEEERTELARAFVDAATYNIGRVLKYYASRLEGAAAREALRRQPSLRPARSLFRRLYAEQHGSEAGLDSTLARLARGHLLRERIDVAAPPLRLTRLPTSDSLRGDSLRAGALDGKVLVLDFWASWCGPCHEAFPHLQDVYEKYRDANDVKFLAVNTSWNDTKARARQFIDEAGYTFPLYWDAGGQVAGAFGVRSIPTTVLIGKGGRVQYREEGFSPRRYEEALTWRIDLLRGL